MGADLFDRFPEWTAEADAILGYSIRELCVNDPHAELGQTAFTQPALFVVNAMTYRARREDGGAPPSFVAGHSLGEYNALHAAGVFGFGEGLRMVQRRGALMGQVTGGGMAAVIGMPPAAIETLLASSDAGARLDVANYNSLEQTVIAGRKEDLSEVGPTFKAAGGRFIPLKVSAPFHSRYMREPMEQFAGFLAEFQFHAPAVPVIANVTARPYAADRIRDTLAEQIGHAVRWLDSVRYLLDHGVTVFEEAGPGTVLTKLCGQIAATRS